MHRYLPTALFVLAAIVAFAACSGGDSTPAIPTTSEIRPPPGPTVLDPIGGPPVATDVAATATPGDFEGTRGSEELRPLDPELAYLSDVRTGRHDEGFDRVTFEFEGGATGYRIEYVDPPIMEDPSDLPVAIDGNAFLRVVFFSASAVDLSTDTPRVTCCVSVIMTGFPSLVDLKETGDFEATLSYVLGLSEEVDFRVGTLQNPYRIYIDVAHP